MADKTAIEWADATWNPTVGCSIVSKGCTNCYAMKMAYRLESMSIAHSGKNGGDPGPLYYYRDLTQGGRRGAAWTGKINLAPPDVLLQPLRWMRPRRIFVNSMSDLFHESIPDAWLDRIFAVMALRPQHTFQVLTKRSERMHAYIAQGAARRAAIARKVVDLAISDKVPLDEMGSPDWPVETVGPIDVPDDIRLKKWPLPNVWLGVSVEDQAAADERIPALLKTPAAVRFLSCEPLLGPVDLSRHIEIRMPSLDADPEVNIGWVIVGGESGPKARPMHPAWARKLRDQCNGADIPFFFKQWGEWLPVFESGFESGPNIDDHPEQSRFKHVVWDPENNCWESLNGCWDDHEQWIIADCYQEPEQDMMRVGKHKAGRTLEGKIWGQMPGVKNA